jgi:predicted phosphodiesterase
MTLHRLEAARGGWSAQDLSKRIVVGEDRILIGSDVHIPYYDEDLMDTFFRVARMLHVQAIVWLGDLMDMPTYSPWGNEDDTTTFGRELRMTEAVLREADDMGIRSYWSYGNHEARLIHRVLNGVGMEELAHMVGVGDLLADRRLITSDNPSLLTTNGWLLTHPGSYSAKPLEMPGAIADLEQMNVVAGHAHHWGLGKSPSGKFTVVESGGLFEPKFMAYLQRKPGKHRKQCKGFVLLDHGTPHLVDGNGKSCSIGI